MDGRSQGLHAHLVCHCLLLETASGLVLVDTGLGMNDVRRPGRLHPVFRHSMGIKFHPARTALSQIRALGFTPADVRHIILTHLDFDHAGGIQDFPEARIHLLEDEYEAAHARHTATELGRYRPSQWEGGNVWIRYPVYGGEPWHGFDSVRNLKGLPPEVLLVPLPGHTLGHTGVAVRTRNDWLLHAGDAYFFHGEMDPVPRVTPGLRAYQRLMEVDRAARLSNQARLRRLRAELGEGLRVFCAHDPTELELQRARNLRAAPAPLDVSASR